MEVLHGALCGYFLKLINGEIPEVVQETVTEQDDDSGIERTYKKWVPTGLMVRPGAGDLAVMAKFLKDNAITGVGGKGSDLKALEEKLAERHQRRGKLPTPADVKQAMAELSGTLLN